MPVSQFQSNSRKNNSLILFVLLLLFIIIWILVRPSQIKKECYKKATKPWYSFSSKAEVTNFRPSVYEECLKEKGL